MRLRVSDLDQWERYIRPRRREWAVPFKEFLKYMKRESEPNAYMQVGTEFHKAMEENTAWGGGEELSSPQGRRFVSSVLVPKTTAILGVESFVEATIKTDVGLVLLRGRVDAQTERSIIDYKLTFSKAIYPSSYRRSFQWRAYLLATGYDSFDYIVFRANNPTADPVLIQEIRTISCGAYPGMANDVQKQVSELSEWVMRHKEHLGSARIFDSEFMPVPLPAPPEGEG